MIITEPIARLAMRLVMPEYTFEECGFMQTDTYEWTMQTENYEFKEELMTELKKVSHREFTTGFYFDKPTNKDQNYQTSAYTREYSFTGMVKSYDPETGYAIVEQRNKMVIGDKIEIFGPGADFFEQVLTEMYDEEGNAVESAPHPQQILKIKVDKPVKPCFMFRKEK